MLDKAVGHKVPFFRSDLLCFVPESMSNISANYSWSNQDITPQKPHFSHHSWMIMTSTPLQYFLARTARGAHGFTALVYKALIILTLKCLGPHCNAHSL